MSNTDRVVSQTGPYTTQHKCGICMQPATNQVFTKAKDGSVNLSSRMFRCALHLED